MGIEFGRSLAIAEELAAADPSNAGWQLDLVTSLFRVSTFLDAVQARPMLRRALAILDPLEQSNKLTTEQRDWPHLFRKLLAVLAPEQAGAQ